MNAKIPPKISDGRVAMVVVSPDPVYRDMDIVSSMDIEEDFNSMMTSSSNQIAFAASLTCFFLRTSNGPSPFHTYLKESAQSVVTHMPHWTSKRKIKTYAIFGAIVRVLKKKVDDSKDSEAEDLFQHLFGDVDNFDRVIFHEILSSVDIVEKTA